MAAGQAICPHSPAWVLPAEGDDPSLLRTARGLREKTGRARLTGQSAPISTSFLPSATVLEVLPPKTSVLKAWSQPLALLGGGGAFGGFRSLEVCL